MLLHESLHAQLAHVDVLLAQLAPDTWPAIRTAILRINSADMHQQGLVAQVAAACDLLAARQMLVIARDTYQ